MPDLWLPTTPRPTPDEDQMDYTWISQDAKAAYDLWMSRIEVERQRFEKRLSPPDQAATLIAPYQRLDPVALDREWRATVGPMIDQAAKLVAAYTMPSMIVPEALYDRVAERMMHTAQTPKPISTNDPVELVIYRALTGAGIPFLHESQGKDATLGLDFMLLTEPPIYIECKAFHTPRTTEQMSRVENVIAIQGIAAAKAFAGMVAERMAEAVRSCREPKAS